MTSFCRGLMVAATCSLIAGTAAAQSRSSAPGKTRQLFVNVSTATGSSVLDLGPADFDVQEGGEKRTVVHAALATTPMRIALMSTKYQVEFLTDTTGPLANVNVGVARSEIKMQLSDQRRFP